MVFRRITIHATERGVEYVRGCFTQVLEPGRYRRPRRAMYHKVSMLTHLSGVATQDILTTDGLNVRVSLVLKWRVKDPRTFLETAENPFDLVYLAAQIALRDTASGLDALAMVRRRDLGDLVEAVTDTADQVGIEVLAVTIKDVVLPADVRTAYAELATAQVRGEAMLAAARAETAALRSMANGAKLLEDHPALARLRLVQSLPAGATIKIASP
jgi:regulator of protease activity HflC (stomatin/prohibitin superfamily)